MLNFSIILVTLDKKNLVLALLSITIAIICPRFCVSWWVLLFVFLFCCSRCLEDYWSRNLQFFSRWPYFWQLKHLFLLIIFHFINLPWNIIAKSIITPIACLLINLTSAEANIYCILLIVLSSHSNILLIVVSKLLCNKLNTTTIAMLFQILQFDIIAARNCFIRNFIFTKILMTSFTKPFGLLTLK